MASPFHDENFVVLRKSFSAATARRASPTAAVPFKDPQLQAIEDQMNDVRQALEGDYRDLLSDANKSYFQREYTIALEKYLELRNKIIAESHPEMPGTAGTGRAVAVDTTKIDSRRVMELTRRFFEEADPETPLKIGGERLILVGEFPVNPAIQPLTVLGLDGDMAVRLELERGRARSRGLVLAGNLREAQLLYARLKEVAHNGRDYKAAAELTAELASMMAAYAVGAARRDALTAAGEAFQEAEGLFSRLGDEPAVAAMKSNFASVEEELRAVPIRPTPRAAVEPGSIQAAREINLPTVQTTRRYLVADGGAWRTVQAVVGAGRALQSPDRKVGLFTADGIKTISLAASRYETELKNALYNPRVSASTLDGIDFHEEIETNFVAYIPHLFFFTLPVAIGDTYLALGRFSKALEEYQSALAYPFLNTKIELPFLWMRMANVYLRWGDDLFRQDLQPWRGTSGLRTLDAKSKYEQIIGANLTVPLTSPLYQPAAMTPMRTTVGEVAKKLKGQPHGAFNSKVAELVTLAHIQLEKIAQGLNFLGLAADHAPIFRFKYLQSVANYLADNAIQIERTFVNFRATAESQKLERLQLENTVDLNQAALDVENKKLEDLDLEIIAAQQSLEYTQLRKKHADESVAEWKEKGWELATINEALTWMSHAASDTEINYKGVKYKDTKHDFTGSVEDAVDTLADWRERLNYKLQLARLQRQAEEVEKEVALAQTRQAQAAIRREVQSLMCDLAQTRLDGSQEVLDYANERMFDEDLWFKLAAELQDISRSYLDMAIYAAFLMERAYDLEFDRNLKRIRLDYGIGGAEGLLGGDYLKRDIASFTLDYLEHAQKSNPVRLVISLRDEFPAAFDGFLREGILPFRTDLELFDRRYPGSFRRKIKKVELFVEGLVPLDGVHGSLLHEGISTDWREVGGSWSKQSRVMPSDRMILSSYQFRRDFSVFQPSEEVMALFENIGVQGNWTLELPRSCNNIDYATISDVKLVLYFDADYSDELASHVRSFYPKDGGRSLVLSARFHFPDEYFMLDTDRKITFRLHPARFPYNYADLMLDGLGIRLVSRNGEPLAPAPLTVVRSSDGSTVQATTDAQGAITADQATMAPFQGWKGGSPVDTFSIQIGPGVDTTAIADIQLFMDYGFTYRADGVLPA